MKKIIRTTHTRKDVTIVDTSFPFQYSENFKPIRSLEDERIQYCLDEEEFWGGSQSEQIFSD